MQAAPEAYVAEPAEPTDAPLLARLRPMLAALVVVLLVGALGYLVYAAQARQDPALDVPVDELDAP